ncbi:MAG: hypothetical protein IJI07_12205 [Flexilinea sp.]|nr:hypothetical protein [Flexilinea sp.]
MNRTGEKNFQRRETLTAGLLFVILCAISGYIILFRPLPRQIGLTFRNTLYVFPLIFLTGLVYGLLKDRYTKIIILSLLFAAILLPYSGMINSGLSDQYALGGVIPWSDAFTMQLNTQRFLYGGQMGQATAIRPISTVFYAVFLRFTGNNYFALQIFLCILTALMLLYTLDAVNKTFGAVCGAAAFTILYYYIRRRFGTFMTEPYGFICGLLSCQLLLTGIRLKKQLPMLLSFLFLSIGLNARPAAMFLFPAAGLWYFFIFLKGNGKRFLWAAFALLLMLSGFVMNRTAQKAVYGEEAIPNRQAAEMVYGLCLGGKAWGDVVSSPEMTALAHSENIIKDVADLCVPILKEHPENILTSLRVIFFDSLIRSEYYGAFSFVNGNPQRLQPFFRYGLMGIWLLGLITLIAKRREERCSFLMVCVLGILISECAAVPFSTNYLRLYAVSMWVPACVAGAFLQALADRILPGKLSGSGSGPVPGQRILTSLTGVLIVLTAVFGASFIKTHPLPKPEALSGVCSEGEELLLTSVDPGSFIYLENQSALGFEHIPYFRLAYVRQHIHDTATSEMFPFTDAIDTPTAIIRGIDLSNNEDALIFSPLSIVEGRTGYAQFCGKFIDPPILRSDRFFITTSVTFLEDIL